LNINEIVVGVDLSQSGRAAVTWAAVQARAIGQTRQAVHAVGLSHAQCMVVAVPAARDHNADKDLDHAAPTPRRITERDHEPANWPAVPIVTIVDATYKALPRSRSRKLALASVRITSGGSR
jgi:hypothetical protein